MMRYDPLQGLSRTPPFVRWTLALECPLREFSEIRDPERTERLLRGARSTSDALAQGRVRNGVAVDPSGTYGFLLDAVLEPLGGLEFVRSQCQPCRANALSTIEPDALASCVGLLAPPEDDAFDAMLGAALRNSDVLNVAETSPRWHGLWIGPVTAERLVVHEQVLGDVVASFPQILGFTDYLAAINVALRTGIQLVAEIYPGGRCEERKWIVDAHCLQCKASWPSEKRQQCVCCGAVGGRQAERVRKRVGIRPYRRLDEFLSQDAIQSLSQS